MHRNRWTSRFVAVAVLSPLFVLSFAAGQTPQEPPEKTGQSPAAPPPNPSVVPASPPKAAAASQSQAAGSAGYVGSEVCKTCHEDVPTKGFYQRFEQSPHFVTTLNTKKGPEWHGCEACHGPGAAHVAGGGDVTKIFTFKDASTKEISARCMTCHAGGPQHMNAVNSIHAAADVSCISCHSPHHAETTEFLLTKSQPALCYSCHLQQKAQFDMPFHHRVNEGLIQCTDCHNPHGSVKPKQVRTSSTQDAICFKCHTDKQGPFVYEHAPIKVDGCQSCHLTHGGPNSHMLKLSNINLMCLQCHTTSSFSSAPGMPSFHNQASLFQSCVLCHSQIHGSNSDATFFK
jgi:DmsE family decaheme c-type cytochrome